MILNVHPGRWQGSDTKACSAYAAKIAFYIRIFVAFGQIIKQRVMFLFTLSIPRWFAIVITQKFKLKKWAKNCKKKKARGVPPRFFSIFNSFFLLKFLSYTIEIHRGILENNRNVAGWLIFWWTPRQCECKIRFPPNEQSKLSCIPTCTSFFFRKLHLQSFPPFEIFDSFINYLKIRRKKELPCLTKIHKIWSLKNWYYSVLLNLGCQSYEMGLSGLYWGGFYSIFYSDLKRDFGRRVMCQS